MLRADGSHLGKVVTPRTAAPEAIALARWFLAAGGAPTGRGRMARHLAAGAVLPEGFAEAPAVAGASVAPGLTASGWLCALAFGQCGADTLAALARHGALRATPWRMLLVEGATEPPQVAGLIHDPDDPLLRMVACSGAPACPQALQPTRSLARSLARDLAPLLPTQLPLGAVVHVSGCAKGCAHPGAAYLTLVGQPDGFGLVRNGRAADPATPLPPGPISPTRLTEPFHAPHL